MKKEFLHENTRKFKEALEFTAFETGFRLELIEKDYFCSVVLDYFFRQSDCETPLVFKGGTLLTKGYAGFYRLSEDLDFCIDFKNQGKTVSQAREQRRRSIAPIKKQLSKIQEVPGLSLVEGLKGSNESKHYRGRVGYQSAVLSGVRPILVEIGLREALIDKARKVKTKTLLIDPFSGSGVFSDGVVTALTLLEAYSEKLRAALSRKTPAIRDFFDLDYAFRKKIIRLESSALVAKVKKKLKVSGNPEPDLSERKLEILRKQVDSELRPTLRSQDFSRFNLDEIWAELIEFRQRLG